MSNGKHKSKKSLREIIDIAFIMNAGGIRKYKKE